MTTQIAFLPFEPRVPAAPTAAEITAAAGTFEGAFLDVTAVFKRAAEGMDKVRAAAYETSKSFSIAFTMTRRDHRRMVTRWARIDRRPALIHNGRKPR